MVKKTICFVLFRFRWFFLDRLGEISDDSDYTSDVSNSLKSRDEMNLNRQIRRINEKSNSLTRDESFSYVSQGRIYSNYHQSIEQIHQKTK